MIQRVFIPRWVLVLLVLAIGLSGGIFFINEKREHLTLFPTTPSNPRLPFLTASTTPGGGSAIPSGIETEARQESSAESTTTSKANVPSELEDCQTDRDRFRIQVPGSWHFGCVESSGTKVYVLVPDRSALATALPHLGEPAAATGCNTDCILISVSQVPLQQTWDRFVIGDDEQFYSTTSFRGRPALQFEVTVNCNGAGPCEALRSFSHNESVSFPSDDRTRVYRIELGVSGEQQPAYQIELEYFRRAYQEVLYSFEFVPPV